MLRLRIPRAEQVKPRQIRIRPVTAGEAKAVEAGTARPRHGRRRRRSRPSPWRQRAGRTGTPTRPVYVISVAATLVSAHPRTLRIYEDEGLVCPARTPTNIRLYSEEDIRRILWIRHLTRDRGVNLAGVRTLFELEERLGKRILEALYDEGTRDRAAERQTGAPPAPRVPDRTTVRTAPRDHQPPTTHRHPQPNRRRPEPAGNPRRP